MTDRKAELAQICLVEIRKTSVISKSRLADYGYHLAESVVDTEIEVMMERLADKSVRPGDVALLRELVIADLWPRLREQHRQHRDYVFDAIKKMNQETISVDAAFAFDIGWRQLLQSAANRVVTYPAACMVTIDGGKEKLGCLVLHIDFDASQRGARSEIARLREEIRLRSLATCDICGESGRLRISSVAKTVCDKHAAVLGEMRDDDGAHADPWKWNADDEEEATSALTEKIAADIKQLSGREGRLLSRFFLEIEEAVRGCALGDADVNEYVRGKIETWILQSLDPSRVNDEDKAWLHGYVRAAIREERERIRDN
ncbi:hypothetical protein [Sinorhizobium meliloti]|uniref:hypothetical protein n=1 Tax=Rhizobium meliloti TaxID=382 RepID=UPI000FE118F6|nr:hypothetical protein [Sinorhizobium meliloti]RVL94711.1 hypothetical protein CN136_21590 [Sinorhizobium meliloti]